jgi:hypothetical protein
VGDIAGTWQYPPSSLYSALHACGPLAAFLFRPLPPILQSPYSYRDTPRHVLEAICTPSAYTNNALRAHFQALLALHPSRQPRNGALPLPASSPFSREQPGQLSSSVTAPPARPCPWIRVSHVMRSPPARPDDSPQANQHAMRREDEIPAR